MTALSVLTTGAARVDPLVTQDLSGSRADVLATMGHYQDRGVLTRWDTPVEHADGTVSVRVHLRDTPAPYLGPSEGRTVYPVWDLGAVTACAVPLAVAGFGWVEWYTLTTMTLSKNLIITVAVLIALAVVGVGALTAARWVRSLLFGPSCPGIPVHCCGCRR